jgi:hypothetical protein
MLHFGDGVSGKYQDEEEDDSLLLRWRTTIWHQFDTYTVNSNDDNASLNEI